MNNKERIELLQNEFEQLYIGNDFRKLTNGHYSCQRVWDKFDGFCKARNNDSDTYRDLCGELLDQVYRCLPYIEDHQGSELYKGKAITARLNSIKEAINKAEKILGA